jgi:hypothetical protein
LKVAEEIVGKRLRHSQLQPRLEVVSDK